VSASGIALGDPVIATFLEFLLQDRECGPVGLTCLAVDLHRVLTITKFPSQGPAAIR
jgi:hypothetical protein